jgi:hypothetical protein
VKRSCLIVVFAVLAFALAAPGVARAGWSWNEGATVATDTSADDPAAYSGTSGSSSASTPDGWSWGGDAAPSNPAPQGWSWGGESSQPSPDGWTWGE